MGSTFNATAAEKEFTRRLRSEAKRIDKRFAYTLAETKYTEGTKLAEAERIHYHAHESGHWPYLAPKTRSGVCFVMLGIFPPFVKPAAPSAEGGKHG